jgi:hypothetical protein
LDSSHKGCFKENYPRREGESQIHIAKFEFAERTRNYRSPNKTEKVLPKANAQGALEKVPVVN